LIKQNFIAYLLDYIIKLEKLDDTLKNLKTDIERIFHKILRECHETLEKIFIFLKMVQNDLNPAAKRQMYQNQVILQSYQASIQTGLQKDAWPIYTLDQVNQIMGLSRKLISVLRQVSNVTMRTAVQQARTEHFA